MFLEKALQALGVAAQHPLALGMYLLVIVSWLVISLRVKRHRVLLKHIDSLPEKDRLKALQLEMGPLPKKGINALQWLRAREQVFKLAQLGVLCVAIIIVASLAVFYFLQAAPQFISIAGQVSVDNRPQENAIITVIGVSGQWTTDRNGTFQFQIPDLVKADSLNLKVVYTDMYWETHLDTTVAKKVAKALQINLPGLNTCFVAGWVMEEVSGEVIKGVQITLDSNRGTGTTDAHGYFRFVARGRPYQKVDATLSHPNFKKITVGLTLSDDNRILLAREQ